MIISETFAYEVTFTVLLILKSTIGKAVMLVMLYILFDVFVSFSVELTATTFAIVPFVITLHMIVSTNSEYAGISPIVHMPVV